MDTVVDIGDLLRRERQAILETAQKRGAENVRVFGAATRGEANEQSDIDFLVDMDPSRSLLDLGELIMDLQELLERKVHVVTPESLHRLIRRKVLQEARPL